MSCEAKRLCEEARPRLKDEEHLEHCEEVTLSSSQKLMSFEINLNWSPRRRHIRQA